MNNKPLRPEDLKEMNHTVQYYEDDSIQEDEFGNKFDIDEITEMAEKDFEGLKQEKNLNMRWYSREIERCKKIARKRGLKYQAYIKMVLKDAMDKDEEQLGLT